MSRPIALQLLLVLSGCGADPVHHGRETRELRAPLVALSVGAADLRMADGPVLVRGGWGECPTCFGKRDEASRPGPMSLALDHDGSVHVLDQVNRRVLVFDGEGRRQAQIPVPETTEEIVLSGAWLWALVYEPGPDPGYRIERHDPSGERPSVALRLDRSIQLVTGLFAAGDPERPDLWVEQRHERQVRVVRGGRMLPRDDHRHAALGRPDRSRPGLRLYALRAGSHRARVRQVDPGRETRPLLEVSTEQPIAAIEALETDARGGLYLALMLGHATVDGLTSVRRVLAVVHGEQRLVVDLGADVNATDCFRRLAVGPDGAIYQLSTGERGVEVRRLRLPGGGGR